MSQPKISQASTWSGYRQTILLLIREALILLRSQPNLPEVEDSAIYNSLNRELFKCFRQTCGRLQLPHHLPVREGKNPPYYGDPAPTDREEKRPDFYWQLIDHLANPDSCERRFILECKRLGHPSSSNWNLNKNYVSNGILRFILPEYGYGKGDDTGGMIGYIQSMELADIVGEVNEAIQITSTYDVPQLEFAVGLVEKRVTELEHTLQRPFPISPFHLYHFWVDLRNQSQH